MIRSAIVVGGGLAGMVVARELAQRQWRVILLERSQRLGGKAGAEVKNGRVVEHGYHVFPKWYPNVRAIVDRMGVRLGVIEAGRGTAGFRLGIRGPLGDYRNALIYGSGLDAGVTTDGTVFIGNPPPLGEVEFQDVETREKANYDLDAAALERYHTFITGWCARLEDACFQRGAAYARVLADWEIERAVVPYLRRRGVVQPV